MYFPGMKFENEKRVIMEVLPSAIESHPPSEITVENVDVVSSTEAASSEQTTPVETNEENLGANHGPSDESPTDKPQIEPFTLPVATFTKKRKDPILDPWDDRELEGKDASIDL